MKGKDIMKASYTYSELASAYGNFMAPAAEVYAGAGMKKVMCVDGAAVENIRVTLSAESAGGLDFQIVNAFDPVSRKIKSQVRSTFAVGAAVEAALGYGSNLTTVFKGYIAELRTSYRDNPVVSVTAVDLRKLMMNNRKLRHKYQEKNCSGVFSEVMQKYSAMYGNIHVDQSDISTELIQNGSDYDFVKNQLCSKGNRNFFMVGKDVYFLTPDKDKTPFLELEWGSSLISFEKGSRYCNEKITAYSSQENKSCNSVSVNIKTESSTPALTTESQTEELEPEPELDLKTLRNYMKKIEDRQKKKNETASGSLIGLPEVVPGRYIKISGVDPADSGSYYITEVRHSFGRDGFTTEFSVGEEDVLLEDKKNKRQDGKFDGVTRAVVRKNWNEEKPGYVLVEFLSGESDKKNTRWLPVLQPYCGDGYGFYFLPEKDTEVAVGSQAGGSNNLVVLGALWNQVDKLPKDTAVEKNTVKKIRTKGGHEITFDDDGENGSLTVKTAKNLNITMSEKEKTITVSDSDGKNSLCIDADKGTVSLKAEKKLSLSVDGKEMLLLSSEGKKLSLEANQISQKADGDLSISAKKLSAKGENTELKAGASMSVSSSGTTKIKGSMVKIN